MGIYNCGRHIRNSINSEGLLKESMEQSLNIWSIQVAYILLMILVIFISLLFVRHRISRSCRDEMLCEFITEEDTGYTKFYPVNEGKITIYPKGGKSGKEYVVGGLRTFIVDYPSVPGFLSIIQSKARKVIFDEASGEPLSNRTPLLLITPHRLFNWSTEKFTGIATKQSEAQADKTMKSAKKPGSSSLMWWIIMLIIAAVVIGGFVIIQKMKADNAAALGISMLNILTGYL